VFPNDQASVFSLCGEGNLSLVLPFWLGSDGLALKRLITRCASTKRRLPLLVWKPKAGTDAVNRISPHLYLESEIVHALMDGSSLGQGN